MRQFLSLCSFSIYLFCSSLSASSASSIAFRLRDMNNGTKNEDSGKFHVDIHACRHRFDHLPSKFLSLNVRTAQQNVQLVRAHQKLQAKLQHQLQQPVEMVVVLPVLHQN